MGMGFKAVAALLALSVASNVGPPGALGVPLNPWAGKSGRHTEGLGKEGRVAAAASRPKGGGGIRVRGAGHCEVAWFEQEVDHFGWEPVNGSTTWEHRYFLCEPKDTKKPANGAPRPIFFYCGNEANVELYVNNTGLMWENAGDMGALMVFAEHRYYGESWPFGTEAASSKRDHLRFLTHEQALADYAHLISYLKERLSLKDSPVVAFGGSYGGMLAAWFRQKYPHIVVGAIAASAPVLAFGAWDDSSYWAAVSRDFSPAGGCSASCQDTIRSAWTPLFSRGSTPAGRAELTQVFNMCSPLSTATDVDHLAQMIAMALDTIAMGNFPYPSSYISDPGAPLPAWPVREVCSRMDAASVSDELSLLAALRDGSAVFYNASKSLRCLEIPKDQSYAGIWDYQFCTQALPQESYFGRTGDKDMFYPFKKSKGDVDKHCLHKYGVVPSRGWIEESYGGIDGLMLSSNIVLSNGGMDPWSSGGVNMTLSDSVISLWIPEGAHHLDLFFSRDEDPASVKEVRKQEVEAIRRWVGQAPDAGAGGGGVAQ